MGYEIIDKADGSKVINRNTYISLSFDPGSTDIDRIRQGFNPYRVIHALRMKDFNKNDFNQDKPFLEIYGSPKCALADSACGMQDLIKKYKQDTYSEREEMQGVKIQLTKILYEDKKCMGTSRELNVNNEYCIGFLFIVDMNFFCWHIPEDCINFKVHIDNRYKHCKLKPLYCSPIVNQMANGKKLALVKWVTSCLNQQNN